MSGHGRGEASSERLRVSAELRSVNNRFCRVSMRLPSDLAFFEDIARRLVQERVQRGKVDLTLSVETTHGTGARLDPEAARNWVVQIHEVADSLAIPTEITVADLLQLPGVITTESDVRVDPEADVGVLEAAVRGALDRFDATRVREGEHLAADLNARVDLLESGVARIEAAAADLPARIRDQLRDRVGELLAEVGAPVDEARLIQEAAYFAERADITEETVRLRSHLARTREQLGSTESVGRGLEFVAQEIHRELTTIGAKTKDLDVAEEVLQLKAELEKIREQVQNIE